MIRLLTLGGVELRASDGTPLRDVLSQKKRVALVCYIALRGVVQRNQLAAMFWPDADEGRARTALRNMLYQIRSELGADALVARGDEAVSLNPDVVWCDAVAFQRAHAEKHWEEALSYYGGELLEGFLPPDLPEFADWLDRQRRTLHQAAAQCARTLAEATSETEPRAAVAWARRWVELSPYDEPAARALLHVLFASGDKAGALDAFDTWSARLQRDLGAEPSAGTLRLVDTIRAAKSPRGAPVAVATASTPLHRHQRLIYAAGIVLLLVTTAIAFLARRPHGNDDAVLAVIPFSYGGSANYRYLREGFVDLLTARIASDGLRTADARAVVAQTNRKLGISVVSPKNGAALARDLGAGFYVLGSMLELNGRINLSASLYSVATNGQPLEEVNLSGSVDSIFKLADAVATSLLRARAVREFAEHRRTWRSDTDSPEAMEAFVDGENAYNAGHFEEATFHYARAIKIDPQFARAFLHYSVAATWLGKNADAIYGAAQRAAELRDHLYADDRLLLDGWTAHLNADPLRADSLYTEYVRLHPENADGWLQRGEVRYHWGTSFGISADDARADFERALRGMPNSAPALMHLIRIAGRDGDTRRVQQLAAQIDRIAPRAQEAAEAHAIRALALQDVAAINEIAGRSGSNELDASALVQVLAGANANPAMMRTFLLNPAVRRHVAGTVYYSTLVNAYAASGLYDAANDAARAFAAVDPNLAFEYRCDLAVLPWRAVDVAAARALLRELPRHAGIPLPRRNRCEALLQLQLGNAAAAEARAQALTAKQPDSVAALYEQHLIRARVALARGDSAAAYAFVRQPHLEPNRGYPTARSFSSALERYTRAQALAGMRSYDEALLWLQTFPDHTGYDVAFVAPARAMMQRVRARLN